MLLVKLSANDLRLIERAKSPDELAGAHQLILDRVAQSKVMKEFGRTPTLKVATRYTWQDALRVVKEVWGEGNVRMPPFPDQTWYVRINTQLKRHGNDDFSIKTLAQYAKNNLKGPSISLDFLIAQQLRILAGEFDAQRRPAEKPGAMGPELPEE